MGALTTTINKKIYVGDGVVLIFPFPYLFYADADLKVYLKDTTTTDAPVLLVDPTHYSMGAGEAGDPAGGNVTMVTEPTSDEELIIERVVDETQESAYADYNRFPATTVEKNLNRLTMMVQQLEEKVNRKLGFDVSESGVGDVPAPIGDTFLGFNTAASAWVLKVIGDISTFVFPASGLIASDGTSTLLGRVLSKIGANITITNGDGLAGNPTIDVSAMDTLIAANHKTADLASTANGKGASDVGYEDAAGDTANSDLEAVIAEIFTLIGASAKIEVGTYTGDGNNNRTIDTGAPTGAVLKYVSIHKDVVSASNQGEWHGSSSYYMAHAPSNFQGIALGTTQFQIDDEDFIVGSAGQLNVNTIAYSWVAVYV